MASSRAGFSPGAAEAAAPLPGFADPVHGAQGVFRALLHASAYPGRRHEVGLAEKGFDPSTGLLHAVGLTLLDFETPFWASDGFAPLAAAIAFHTGASIAPDPSRAPFCFVSPGDPRPSLSALEWGDDAYPERGATLLLGCRTLEAGGPGEGAARFEGPGIQSAEMVHSERLDPAFLEEWQAVGAAFPRGIDVFLCHEHSMVGLPRSVRLSKG